MSVDNWNQTFGGNIVSSSSRVDRSMTHGILHSS
jgi:hypothetical protein